MGIAVAAITRNLGGEGRGGEAGPVALSNWILSDVMQPIGSDPLLVKTGSFWFGPRG